MYLFDNPVLQRELLVNLRMIRAFVLQFMYLGLLGLLVYFAWPHDQKIDTRNPQAANAILVASSLAVDAVTLFVLAYAVFGPSFKPFLGLFALFILRQLAQATAALPVPKGIIWRDAHNICANAAIYAGIPAMDRLKEGPAWELIRTGDWVRLDADRGIVEVLAKG